MFRVFVLNKTKPQTQSSNSNRILWGQVTMSKKLPVEDMTKFPNIPAQTENLTAVKRDLGSTYAVGEMSIISMAADYYYVTVAVLRMN